VRLLHTVAGSRWLSARRSLVVDDILRAAERATGLCDFGDDDFLEPLRLLAAQFDQHARLHPLGRLLIGGILQSRLEMRLLLAAAWKRHPERLQCEPIRPLYVVGLPRTGTTLLYNLLAQHPNARPLLAWEAFYPASSKRSEQRGSTWNQRTKARLAVSVLNVLCPDMRRVHPINPAGPEEDAWFLNNTLCSPMFFLNGDVPGYLEYVESLTSAQWRTVYAYYRHTLQFLQQDNQRHWVLKSPVHLGTLGELLEAMPTARVVCTHRDPRDVLASSCSLVCLSRSIFSDDVDPKRVGVQVAQQLVRAVDRANQARQRFGDRIMDITYEQLTRDPLGTVRSICERFGDGCSADMEARMQRWQAANAQGKHGMHRYRLEQFGLTVDDCEHFQEALG